MNGSKVLFGSGAAFLIAVALSASGCAPRQPGRLLVEYPAANEEDWAKIHPAPSVTDNRPKLALEAFSQKVADDILRAEAAHAPLCATNDARYFQIKAVYELRDSELDLANRDLQRAEDALRQTCVVPPPALVGAPARERAVHRRHRRVIRHKRHCKCK